MEHDPSPRFARLRRGYTAAALYVLNALLFLVVLNVVFAVALRLEPRPPVHKNPSSFARDKLAATYGDMPMDVVEGTLDEIWNVMRVEAKPWVHYGESPIAGKYVNVSREGVRSNRRAGSTGASPREHTKERPFRIDFFGGSTTFGYGVPDWETIPAHLERILAEKYPDREIVVRNYGRGYYCSSQELALFVSILRREGPPDAVIFLDGLNDLKAAYPEGERLVFDEPTMMGRLRELWEEGVHPPRPRILPTWVPMVQVSDRLREALRSRAAAPPDAPAPPPAAASGDVRQEAGRILDTYLLNKRMIEAIAAAGGTRALFFWQPVPYYAYDIKRNLFAHGNGRRADEAMKLLYEEFARRETGTTNLSDLLRDYENPAYVDVCHYTPNVNALIAGKIAEKVTL